MEKSGQRSSLRWLFAVLTIGGLVSCGIFIGIMSIEGITSMRLVQALGFAALGLVMLWGAIHSQ